MEILNNFFSGNQNFKECPRCLGKGKVDWDDIKRLNQELKWMPGMCAYCNGTGKVDSQIESKVPVDASYLVIDLNEDERNRILSGDTKAIEHAKQYDSEIEAFINRITYLYFDANLTPIQIANQFLMSRNEFPIDEKEQKELIEYINRVIEKKSKN